MAFNITFLGVPYPIYPTRFICEVKIVLLLAYLLYDVPCLQKNKVRLLLFWPLVFVYSRYEKKSA
jgi:hypothetical protein